MHAMEAMVVRASATSGDVDGHGCMKCFVDLAFGSLEFGRGLPACFLHYELGDSFGVKLVTISWFVLVQRRS